MKKCFKCKCEKPLVEFCADNRKPDGRGYECLVCKRERSKKYRQEGRDKEYWKRSDVLKRKQEWNKKDYEQNKEQFKERNKKWILSNYERYRKYQTAYTASYRFYKKQATPKWTSEEAIFEFYKNCPQGKEVDHIIPLNHPDICGLHVPCNLQYLSRFENAAKSNKWDGTYENESWRLKLTKKVLY